MYCSKYVRFSRRNFFSFPLRQCACLVRLALALVLNRRRISCNPRCPLPRHFSPRLLELSFGIGTIPRRTLHNKRTQFKKDTNKTVKQKINVTMGFLNKTSPTKQFIENEISNNDVSNFSTSHLMESKASQRDFFLTHFFYKRLLFSRRVTVLSALQLRKHLIK